MKSIKKYLTEFPVDNLKNLVKSYGEYFSETSEIVK